MKCPICKYSRGDKVIRIDCGNFDNSPLYRYADIASCKKCGHVYNKLDANSISGLVKYYNQEYAPNNLSSTSFGGDRPGSADKFSLRRYENLYELIKPHIASGNRILDAGCACGGFLDFLSQKGFRELYGIDISEKYLQVAKKIGHRIKYGSVEAMPFKKGAFDLIITDQVLEHLVNPSLAFSEARRTLSPEGLLCVSVPDAARYEKYRFFDFYWFLLREHVQHFDLKHLNLLASMHGFDLVGYSLTTSGMMSQKMVLPALNMVFRLRSKTNAPIKKDKSSFSLKRKIISYIKQELEKSHRKERNIRQLILLKKPLYLYGMSREFLYLYKLGIEKCNITGLIDDTEFKQKKLKVDGRKIRSRSVLKNAPSDSNLIITAFAHTSKLKSNLKKVGYKGKIIEM